MKAKIKLIVSLHVIPTLVIFALAFMLSLFAPDKPEKFALMVALASCMSLLWNVLIILSSRQKRPVETYAPSAIKHNATIAAQSLHATFDLEGVRKLTAQIKANAAAMKSSGDYAPIKNLTDVLGSFYGECIARAVRGHWVFVDEKWHGIHIAGTEVTVNPWAKVAAALNGEDAEQIMAFFVYLASGQLPMEKTSG